VVKHLQSCQLVIFFLKVQALSCLVSNLAIVDKGFVSFLSITSIIILGDFSF
jgi:hypothetical protein